MFPYDQHVQFAAAWTKSWADMATQLMATSTPAPAVTAPTKPAGSWYKAPAVNPFDWSTWLTPSSASLGMPWGAINPWGSAVYGGANMPVVYPSWSAVASFASTMAALEPAHRYWSGQTPTTHSSDNYAWIWQVFMWPMNQLDATSDRETQSGFASFRSSGGHAAAQIVTAVETTDRPVASKLH